MNETNVRRFVRRYFLRIKGVEEVFVSSFEGGDLVRVEIKFHDKTSTWSLVTLNVGEKEKRILTVHEGFKYIYPFNLELNCWFASDDTGLHEILSLGIKPIYVVPSEEDDSTVAIRGSEDDPVLILSPQTSRAINEHLVVTTLGRLTRAGVYRWRVW